MAVAIGAVPESPSWRTEVTTPLDLREIPRPPPFRIVLSRVDRDVVISPHGDIDSSTSATLALALSSLLAEDRPSIVLDLADVEAVAVDRAWVIAEASRLVTQRDGRLAVVAANPAVRAVLRAADLGWLLVDAERPVPHFGADDAENGAE